MRPPIGIARRQAQQTGQRSVTQRLGIVDKQIDLLPGQRQLPDLRQNRRRLRPLHLQPLRYLPQHAVGISRSLSGNHHTLHRLFIGAGDQRLAQQRLAAALRTAHHQQQLAVAREMVQLPQHGLALGRKKLEPRHPSGKGIMGELVVIEKSLVGMQTGHGALINF
ncbi:hypothetical protein D9M68_698900 [compost metagenome]